MELYIDMADEERYNNRQIERMLDSQSLDLKAHMDSALAPVLAQVTKTNGRVTDLELKRANQAGFNRAISVAASVGFTVLLALSGWALYQVSLLPSTIHAETQEAVQEALAPYITKNSI